MKRAASILGFGALMLVAIVVNAALIITFLNDLKHDIAREVVEAVQNGRHQ